MDNKINPIEGMTSRLPRLINGGKHEDIGDDRSLVG